MLPGIKSHATCIRFCPYLFKLKNNSQGILNLPYKIFFAVATIDHLLIYSTESTMPIAIVKNIHLDSINDIAWMGDRLIIVASSDGFCSFI
jgi:chromatin assembly factor 1 subunit B